MDPSLRQAARDYLVRYGGDTFANLFRSAKGSIVVDDTGREILDFTSGQMCATIGHNHPAIVRAVQQAGERAYHMFSGMIPEVVAELGRTMARDWMPQGMSKSLFINTGSESNEAALRIAKMYTGGYEVLAVGGSWHGVTGGVSATSFASDRKGYGVPVPGVHLMPEPNMYRPYIRGLDPEASAMACLELGLKMYDMASTGRRAAIVIEPVISARRTNAAGVVMEMNNCRQAFPQHYIRLMAFDSTRGVERIAMSFIVNRPAREPGFKLERQEVDGRSMRYTVRGYAADRP